MTSRELRLAAIRKSLSIKYVIRMGFPNMDGLYRDLEERCRAGSLSREERTLFEKLVTALRRLHNNPRDPLLETREVEELSSRYRMKIWQSSLDRESSAPDRIFWLYGPANGEITVLSLVRGKNAG